MSCFGSMHTTYSKRSKKKPWWWCKCSSLTTAIHSKLRHLNKRRRGHRRSFAPVYVDELYSQPRSTHVLEYTEPSTSAKARVVSTNITSNASASTSTMSSSRSLMSPSRGVLGVVKGMGEVDLRAELFIRKFREEMRLQSQRSVEEFQAMLARGL